MIKTSFLQLAGVFIIVSSLLTSRAQSHCDTMNGPVVKDAKLSLENGDVTPVLKWVKPEYEGEIRQLFMKTLVVRAKGAESKEVADMYFFETLVRLHRAGEGEPYTGLKPEGTQIEPGIEAADLALESGKVEDVVRKMTEDITEGVRSRFERVQKMKKDAGHSVESGRSYVAAYVEFIHFVEGIHQAALAREVHDVDTHDAHHNAHPQ